MDRRERFNDLNTALLTALQGFQAGLWTAMPAIINSYDPVAQTITAQPTIMGRVQARDGSFSWVKMPLLVDVPVCFPGGGGFVMTFPIAQGDEALIVFTSRCIDAWWQLGGVQVQAEMRMHDLSDGFAIVGPRSQPKRIENVSTTSAQLRNIAGDCFIEMADGGVVNIMAPGGFNVTSNTNFFGQVVANSKRIDETHKHKDVITGTDDTGVVA